MPRVAIRLSLIAALGAIVLSLACAPSREQREMAAELRVLCDHPPAGGRGASPPESVRAMHLVKRFYARRGFRPAWVGFGGSGVLTSELLRALRGASAEGLHAIDVDLAALTRTLSRPRSWSDPAGSDPAGEAILDFRMTRAYFVAALESRHGQLPPHALDPDWNRDTARTKLDEQLAEAISHRAVPESLATCAPRDSSFEALRLALLAYREIAARGGWPHVPAGRPLRRGASGARVDSLRARLAVTGDLSDGTPRGAFDAALAAAVRRFQSRHGIEETGIVDEATHSALNVSAAERVRTMELNLERRRWLAWRRPGPRVEVNLPAYTLEARAPGLPAWRTRVVVGDTKHSTPVFTDAIVWIDVNPEWTLSRRIVAEEILPEMQHDKHYLEDHEMQTIRPVNGQLVPVDPAAVDWDSVSSDTFRTFIRQAAGDKNPLGRLRFMCPNEYDVYLHDTSARELFRRPTRARSHGCVRVEYPEQFAAWLRSAGADTMADSVRVAIATTLPGRWSLPHRVPVDFSYWTAWVAADGTVEFRDDVYDLDRRLDAALRARRADLFEINPAATWDVPRAP